MLQMHQQMLHQLQVDHLLNLEVPLHLPCQCISMPTLLPLRLDPILLLHTMLPPPLLLLALLNNVLPLQQEAHSQQEAHRLKMPRPTLQREEVFPPRRHR